MTLYNFFIDPKFNNNSIETTDDLHPLNDTYSFSNNSTDFWS